MQQNGILKNPVNIHRDIRRITLDNAGCGNNREYRQKLAVENGFKNNKEYLDYLARKRGFDSHHEYLECIVSMNGFSSYSEYIGHIQKHTKRNNYQKCYRCKKHILLNKKSYHHIIPRKYKGHDDDYNRMPLCIECHNYVEIKTEEWISSGKIYNISILMCTIINDGFD